MKRLALALLPILAVAAPPAAAQAEDPTALASPEAVEAQLAAMEAAMKPGQTFAWQPLLRGGSAVAALEIWKAPGRPAVHPDEAEYAVVVAGAGTLVSGGTLIEPEMMPYGVLEGSRIEGGTTRPLREGDIFLVPAGVPHWFGITGDRLVLLGIKVPTPKP